eukprot:tig00000572_g2205.t1
MQIPTIGTAPELPDRLPTLRVASINTQSSRGPSRIAWLATFLREADPDILAVVDHRWHQEDAGTTALRPEPGYKRGVAFIVRNRPRKAAAFAVRELPLPELAPAVADDVLAVELTLPSPSPRPPETIILVAIYAPNAADKQAELAEELTDCFSSPRFSAAHLIFLGDFNAFADPALDSRGHRTHQPFDHWADALAQLGLEDVLRRRMPTTPLFTHYTSKAAPSRSDAARLDYIFPALSIADRAVAVASLCARARNIGRTTTRSSPNSFFHPPSPARRLDIALTIASCSPAVPGKGRDDRPAARAGHLAGWNYVPDTGTPEWLDWFDALWAEIIRAAKDTRFALNSAAAAQRAEVTADIRRVAEDLAAAANESEEQGELLDMLRDSVSEFWALADSSRA